LALAPFQQAVAVHILAELAARVSFVNDVGLGYLTLDRLTRTLSGGEAQRIALSNALGSHLVDTLYVLDEPSIGLHPSDIDRLLGLLRRLADAGNTVAVVEHDPAAIRAADWMIELGPGSGEAGGQVVYQGPAAAVRDAGTLTGQYLSGEKRIGVPSARRPARRWLSRRGARRRRVGRDRGRGARRSGADRPDSPVQPGDLHQGVRRAARPVRRRAAGAGARLHPEHVFFQRGRGPLRGV